MERVYKRNILSQQIWYKTRLLKDISRRCDGRKRSLLLILLVIYLLDSLIGVLVVDFTLLSLDRGDVASYATFYILSMLKWTRTLLEWLMNVPAGLKLNDQLTEFLSEKFIYLLRLWEFYYSVILVRYLQYILHFILYLRFTGLTVVLSMLFDFLKFLNIWLICFYVFSRQIVKVHLSALLSLFRLFMGRKWNPLRNRVDSIVYDQNQLLLGTLFFISLLFLLPTTAMFYGVFLSLRAIQYSLQSIIRLLIVFVNRLILQIMKQVCNRYVRPEISTLIFHGWPSIDDHKSVSMVAVFNNTEYDLCDVTGLVQSSCIEDTTIACFDSIDQLSMNKWFDINPF